MKPVIRFFLTLVLMTGVFASAQNEKKALKNAYGHLKYDEFKLAIPYLEEAVSYNSENAYSQFLLGKCLFLSYQKRKAYNHLRKAYLLDKQVNEELFHYYARALHYVLEFDKAIEIYQLEKQQYQAHEEAYQEALLAIEHCKYAKRAVKNPVNAKIENVGPRINTPFSEHSPIISADESVMIYTTVRPDNKGCNGDPQCTLEDIYITYQNGDNNWVKPQPIENINSKGYDASIALSPDGQKLFIYKNPPGNGDIFSCELKGVRWTNPESLGEPVNSRHYEETVSISADGNTLLFTSMRPGGLGKTDIYMSKLDEDGDWDDPINLGPQINTSGDDKAPFLHPNGRTLYFSSNSRLDGIGGYDIYKAELQEDGTWSRPQNIGYPINTPDDDIYFQLSADGKHGYYASAKEGGYGEKDIYRIVFQFPKPKVDTITSTDTVVKEVFVQNPLTILKGTITDAITQEPLEAAIKVIDNEKNVVIAEFRSNSATGKYLVTLPSGKNYGINVEKEDYLFHSENFNIPLSTDYQEFVKDIELKKVKVGEAIVLRNIFFDYDKATLRPESQAELDRLYKLLTDLPKLEIEIGGHTDADGSDTYNEQLSQRRANSVVEYLIQKGISKSRLVAKGYGERNPIDTNDTPEGKQNNRRTEFKILKN